MNPLFRSSEPHFVFREVQTADELLELFRLRYQTYRHSRLRELCCENDEGIDVDTFDSRSRHFGLWQHDATRERLTGGIRVVTTHATGVDKLMNELAGHSLLIGRVLKKRPSAPLPLLTYEAVATKVSGLFGAWRDEGEQIVEVTRFCLAHEFRGTGLVQLLVEATLSIGFYCHWCVNRALISCSNSQSSYYSRYGFQVISDALGHRWDVHGVPGCTLAASPADVPIDKRPALRKMARSFEITGTIQFPAELLQGSLPAAHRVCVEAVA